jgi:hypothetical protein
MYGRLLLIGAVLVSAGCAAASQSEGPRSNPDLITQAEIQGTSAANALDVIRRLRPMWLRVRSRGDAPVVYVDGTRRVDANALVVIAAELVLEMRHLSASDATTRFGTGHRGGAILIVTRR